MWRDFSYWFPLEGAWLDVFLEFDSLFTRKVHDKYIGEKDVTRDPRKMAVYFSLNLLLPS